MLRTGDIQQQPKSPSSPGLCLPSIHQHPSCSLSSSLSGPFSFPIPQTMESLYGGIPGGDGVPTGTESYDLGEALGADLGCRVSSVGERQRSCCWRWSWQVNSTARCRQRSRLLAGVIRAVLGFSWPLQRSWELSSIWRQRVAEHGAAAPSVSSFPPHLPLVPTGRPPAEEVDVMLQRCEGGVDAALQYAKNISKYMKDLIGYLEKRTTLGEERR